MHPIKEKIKCGVIGLGHQSSEDHLPAIFASPDIELKAVADIDKTRLLKFSEKNQNVHTYEHFEDLLSNEKLDFIIIAVPHNLHFDIVKTAIKHGVNILKEKPYAISLAQAREIKMLADKKGIKIAVTLQRRFNPIYSTFFQFIDKIGTPFFIDAKYTFHTNFPDAGWRGKKEIAGGGCLIDMGYHIVDLLMWYFGLPDLVFADTSCAAKEDTQYDAEDTAKIMFRYLKREMFGSILLSRVIPPKSEYFDVYGTRGIIHIERGKIERRATSGEIQESLSRENHWPSAAQDQIDFFIKVLRGEKENVSGPDFHFNHLAFIEAAYKSKQEGRFIVPKTYIYESGLKK